MRINYLYFFVLFLLFQSCTNGKLVTENKNLRLKVADLEHRIYELTDSPDQLAKDLLQDIDLLTTISNRDNLEFAKAMVLTFYDTYPDNKYIDDIKEKEEQIDDLLVKLSSNNLYGQSEMDKNSSTAHDKQLKVQFSVQINERNSRFINVELSAQNMSNIPISNVWIKATLVDKNGGEYGITQDFFFNRLSPYEFKLESLSWEYVQFDHIGGIILKQLRYSKNRQTMMLKEHECLTGQGNVKIFLEF